MQSSRTTWLGPGVTTYTKTSSFHMFYQMLSCIFVTPQYIFDSVVISKYSPLDSSLKKKKRKTYYASAESLIDIQNMNPILGHVRFRVNFSSSLIRVHRGIIEIFFLSSEANMSEYTKRRGLLYCGSQVCGRLWRDFIGRWAHWLFRPSTRGGLRHRRAERAALLL